MRSVPSALLLLLAVATVVSAASLSKLHRRHQHHTHGQLNDADELAVEGARTTVLLPDFKDVGDHKIAVAAMPQADNKKADAKTAVGALVYVYEGFKDVDRIIGVEKDGKTPLKYAANPGAGITAANAKGLFKTEVSELATWFSERLWKEGAATEKLPTKHNKDVVAGYDGKKVLVATECAALYNALWGLFTKGTPVGHWGVAVAHYVVVGRYSQKVDVYWVAGADNTGLGKDDVEHTEHRILKALKDFEDNALLPTADKTLTGEKVTIKSREIVWALLFPPCADDNRACDKNVAEWDARAPPKDGAESKFDAKDVNSPVPSTCPVAGSNAKSHIVWFVDPKADNTVIKIK